MNDRYLERALFVVGNRHTDKSTQLRSMFLDVRLGSNGQIPTERKPEDFHRLTNDRFLYLRLSSPHELEETLPGFLRKTKDKIDKAKTRFGRRWNFASALQAQAVNNMPDVVETCEGFVDRFKPEPVRVIFLNPNRKDEFLDEKEVLGNARRLRRIPVEVCWINAQDVAANGLFLADFFAF